MKRGARECDKQVSSDERETDATLTDDHERLFDFGERFDERVTELPQSVQHTAELAQYICAQTSHTHSPSLATRCSQTTSTSHVPRPTVAKLALSLRMFDF